MYSQFPVSTSGQQVVGPARVDPGGEARRPAGRAGILERRPHHRVDVGRVDERHHRRRHHVDPRCQDAGHVVDGLGGAEVRGRRVADAVGAEREQFVHVVRRGDAERLDADQLTDVATDLVGAVDPQPHQLQIGMACDQSCGVVPDVAGTPLDHLVGHRFPLFAAATVSHCRGCSSMVEPQVSNLLTRVRFPSPALRCGRSAPPQMQLHRHEVAVSHPAREGLRAPEARRCCGHCGWRGTPADPRRFVPRPSRPGGCARR